MKKVLITLVSLLTLITVWSCKDKFLEFTPPPDQLTDVTGFKTTDQFNSFIISAYTELLPVAEWVMMTGYISQDVVVEAEDRKPLTSYMIPTEVSFRNYWEAMYMINSRANIVLEKIKVAPPAVSAGDRTRIEGEAKFLRGFANFNIARAFGNAPLLLESYDPTRSATQTIVSCTPEDKIWDQVILDLTEASQKLPDRSQWGAANLGRATKGAALAFLANAYMYKKDWANAAKASADLDELKEYRLKPDVSQVYSLSQVDRTEAIFEVQFRAGGFEWSNQRQTGTLLGPHTAPREIGSTYAPFGGWGGAALRKDLRASMETGDDRGVKLIKTLGDTYKGELMSEPIIIGNTDQTASGKQQRILQRNSDWSTKYWQGNAGSALAGSNVPLMRYAEFLLNYAEILFKQNKPVEAYAKLNEVRRRAKLGDKPVSTNEEEFMTALMNERRWELFLEPNLWFHYTRTGRAAAFITSQGVNYAFQPKWNKFPIPQNERNQNPNLCQNEGY